MEEKFKLCSKCHKRIAVVFLSKVENGEQKSEGICLQCAKELGIKPINDMMDNLGLTDEVLDALDGEIESYADAIGEDGLPEAADQENDGIQNGRAPAFDIRKLLNIFGNNPNEGETKSGEAQKKDAEKDDKKAGKKEKSGKSALDSYCLDLTGKAAVSQWVFDCW